MAGRGSARPPEPALPPPKKHKPEPDAASGFLAMCGGDAPISFDELVKRQETASDFTSLSQVLEHMREEQEAELEVELVPSDPEESGDERDQLLEELAAQKDQLQKQQEQLAHQSLVHLMAKNELEEQKREFEARQRLLASELDEERRQFAAVQREADHQLQQNVAWILPKCFFANGLFGWKRGIGK